MIDSWVEPVETPMPEALQEAVGGHPLVARTLARRGFNDIISARAFLDPDYYTPSPPSELPGLMAAADRVQTAFRNGENILVWGDFDVDGQTATTLLVSALLDLGGVVAYHIPVRALESHGVNLPVLSELLDGEISFRQRSDHGQAEYRTVNGRVALVLTCDTGIAAREAVDFARSRGVEVVITDHHELPETLPQAAALVNPNLLSSDHPLASLPGVGVAYKLVEELYRRDGRTEDCEGYLDLVSLGIVADVARLTGDTRYLLQLGLTSLRDPQRLGLQALYERAELDAPRLTEEHIGFVLAPRLNAIGRLGDANPVVELLTTEDMGRARHIALQLEGYNNRRRLFTSQVFRAAIAQIEADRSLLEATALVLAHPAWHAGVIGIVASRLVELYRMPAVLIASPEDELGRGSARSVDGVDITAAIASQSDLLESYGGHAMAAGLSIRVENIPAFRRGLSRYIERSVPEEARRVPPLVIDGYLAWDEISLDLASDLERLAPFGAGNPPLVLASRDLSLAVHRQVGRNQEHLILSMEDESGLARKAVWWNGAEELEMHGPPQGRFDLAYTVGSTTYAGQREVQVSVVDLHLHPEEEARLAAKAEVEILDHRLESHPFPILEKLVAEEGLQIWAEAEGFGKLHQSLRGGEGDTIVGEYRLCSRHDLSPSHTLVIWTAPPSRTVLREALEAVKPQRIHLFAIDPGLDEPQIFLERLTGLVKYALKTGRISLSKLAAAMAHGELTARMGIEWLVNSGYVSLVDEFEDIVVLTPGGERQPEMAEATLAQLKDLLEEARSFRAYFRRAEALGLDSYG